MSTIIDVTDALVARLNVGEFSQPITAERKYQPVDPTGRLAGSVSPDPAGGLAGLPSTSHVGGFASASAK